MVITVRFIMRLLCFAEFELTFDQSFGSEPFNCVLFSAYFLVLVVYGIGFRNNNDLVRLHRSKTPLGAGPKQ
ncbi:hypothetical protein L1987_80102 [Smallanthus sonchifolius]|uniref:Uncharacterized protein n=1 Tax=Smallanthus sonchifolius TaxID=185202 RepID=A0ACB8YMU0_9ASTR|nr:hypothetical protein L1987_80102 [Smallanthus sonchifolius]